MGLPAREAVKVDVVLLEESELCRRQAFRLQWLRKRSRLLFFVLFALVDPDEVVQWEELQFIAVETRPSPNVVGSSVSFSLLVSSVLRRCKTLRSLCLVSSPRQWDLLS